MDLSTRSCLVTLLKCLVKSLMYIIQRRGERTPPWGIPLVKDFWDERKVPEGEVSRTAKVRVLSHSVMNLMYVMGIFSLRSVLTSLGTDAVSKAPLMSKLAIYV